MNRRQLFGSAAALAAVAALPRPLFARSEPSRTQWTVGTSEGLDALCFLGALSGSELHLRFHAAAVEAFAPRLPEAIRADVPKIWAQAGEAGFGLLGPSLCAVLSGGDVLTIDGVVALLEAPEARIRPSYAASPYWDEADWAWLSREAPRLLAIFTAMRDAGFARFHTERLGADIADHVADAQAALAGYDVVRWQEKLTGRAFDPGIQVKLLLFAKPHGIKVQGQTFLQDMNNTTATTVRIAAHEMLHPPFPMVGRAATAALKVLADDPLITRIVRDHDPKWGYTTLDGLLNEDVCEALDQLISEALGVARNPADRWTKADDGIHVIAAGLYGLLRQDTWIETGGDIEAWIGDAAASGRLAPDVLHPAAARVLERPVGALWPLA